MNTSKELLKGKKIAFLGDSITLGYGLENREDRFSTVTSKMLGAIEENYGITGTLVARAGLNNSDDNAYIDRVHLVDNADYIVIFGGTNDYFWSDCKIAPEDVNETDEKYFTVAVDHIIEHCKEVNDASNILIVTPYPHHGIGNFLGGADFKDKSEHDTSELNYNGHHIGEYAEYLVKAATEAGVNILDLYTDSDFVWQELTSDGCHPNPKGHIWLAERVAAKLLSMAEGK